MEVQAVKGGVTPARNMPAAVAAQIHRRGMVARGGPVRVPQARRPPMHVPREMRAAIGRRKGALMHTGNGALPRGPGRGRPATAVAPATLGSEVHGPGRARGPETPTVAVRGGAPSKSLPRRTATAANRGAEDAVARFHVGTGSIHLAVVVASRSCAIARVVPATAPRATPTRREVKGAPGVTGTPPIDGALVPEAKETASTLPVHEVTYTVSGSSIVARKRVIQVAARPSVNAGLGPEEVPGLTLLEKAGLAPKRSA